MEKPQAFVIFESRLKWLLLQAHPAYETDFKSL